MTPSRQIFWNIPTGFAVYLVTVVVLATLVYGFYRRYRLWRLGGRDDRFDHIWERVGSVLIYGLGQGRIIKEPLAGIMHSLVLWGFLVLLLGTLLVAVHEDLKIRLLEGNFYLWYSLFLDLFGLLVLGGVLVAAWRRYVQRPDTLDNTPDDAAALILISVIVVSGFAVEGARIAATELDLHRDWAQWSPVGLAFASFFAALGVEQESARLWHGIFWWGHLLLASGGLAYVPYSKLAHIFLSPLNIFFRNLRPKGALPPMSLQHGGPYGVGNIRDFTWKHLLDLDACTRCGRCQDNCPAYLSGKSLSPKGIIRGLKGHLTEVGPIIRGRLGGGPAARDPLPPLVGDSGAVLSEQDLWACTTCRACLEHCPIFVEPMDKMLEMRRHQAMVANRVPEGAQLALHNMEVRGHPWAGTQLTRTGWTKGLGIKEIGQAPDAELLYWVGCTGAMVDRNVKVTIALAKVLKLARVDFAILGDEENCCGDPARRLGAEHLFQLSAQQNIETIAGYGVKKILTHCPHCYNTFKNEYLQLGADFEVIHHTQLLADLFSQGRLVPGAMAGGNVVYHDSCYLGRYNDIFEAPRRTLASIAGGPFLEMERRGKRSSCCGAGGGHAWIEEQGGRRISKLRLEEAQKTGAKGIASACPFCLQMFEDGIAGAAPGDDFRAWDIAELVYQSLSHFENRSAPISRPDADQEGRAHET